MNRRTVRISIVTLGLLLSVAILAMLTVAKGGAKFTVTFVNTETCTGPFPNMDMSERLAFAFRNAGSNSGSVYVGEIEDGQGNRVQSDRLLGEAAAGQTTQLYLYLPQGQHPRSVRVRVLEDASVFQKARFALRMLIRKAAGRYSVNQVWFGKLRVPAYEFVVKLDKAGEPVGAAKGGQPVGSETNQASAVAGSSR
jgi:hypothetical protein